MKKLPELAACQTRPNNGISFSGSFPCLDVMCALVKDQVEPGFCPEGSEGIQLVIGIPIWKA